MTAWMTASVRLRPFGRRRGLPTVVCSVSARRSAGLALAEEDAASVFGGDYRQGQDCEHCQHDLRAWHRGRRLAERRGRDRLATQDSVAAHAGDLREPQV